MFNVVAISRAVRLLKRYVVIFGVSALAAAVARADPATAAATAALPFQICRLAGTAIADSHRPIAIPAGTEYDEAAPSAEGDVSREAAVTLRLHVVTTAAATIPADSFCVIVPVKRLGDHDPAILRASIGEMFVLGGNWRNFPAGDPLIQTYGYWKSPEG